LSPSEHPVRGDFKMPAAVKMERLEGCRSPPLRCSRPKGPRSIGSSSASPRTSSLPCARRKRSSEPRRSDRTERDEAQSGGGVSKPVPTLGAARRLCRAPAMGALPRVVLRTRRCRTLDRVSTHSSHPQRRRRALGDGVRWATGPVWFGDGRYIFLMGDIPTTPDNEVGRRKSARPASSQSPRTHANGIPATAKGRLVIASMRARVPATEYERQRLPSFSTASTAAAQFAGRRVAQIRRFDLRSPIRLSGFSGIRGERATPRTADHMFIGSKARTGTATV